MLSLRKYLNGMLLVASVPFFSIVPEANAGTVTISCPYRNCILRFETSAGWQQRVHIRRIGGGLSVTREGSGESNKLHFRSVVDGGAFQVTAWHNKPGQGWQPSAMITTRFARGHFARSDDGGGGNDRDFNDSVVSLTPF